MIIAHGISEALMRDVAGCFGRALPGARLPGFASGTRSSNLVASWSRRRHALFGARLPDQTPKDDLHTHTEGVRHTLADRCPLFVAWSILTSTILPSIRLLKVRCKRSGYVAGRVPIRIDVSYLGTLLAVLFSCSHSDQRQNRHSHWHRAHSTHHVVACARVATCTSDAICMKVPFVCTPHTPRVGMYRGPWG